MVRVDATTMCVRTLEDVDEWRLRRGDQDCLDPEDQYTAWDELDLIVGDCVRVNVHHPVTVIEQEIDCPNP